MPRQALPRPPKPYINVRNSLPMRWIEQNGADLLRELIAAPNGKPHFVRSLAFTEYLFYHAQRATLCRVSTSRLRRVDIFSIPAIDALLREVGAYVAFLHEDVVLQDPQVGPTLKSMYPPVFGSHALPFVWVPSFDFGRFAAFCGSQLGSAFAPAATETSEKYFLSLRFSPPPHHFPLDADGVIIYRIIMSNNATSLAQYLGITDIALIDVAALRSVLARIFKQTLPPPAIYRALDFFCAPSRIIWRQPDGTARTLRWGPPIAIDGFPPISYLPPEGKHRLSPRKHVQGTARRNFIPITSENMAYTIVEEAAARKRA